MDNNVIMNGMINNIRVHGAILVMGAGASFESGLPLYAQLAPVVWQVVDGFDSIKKSLKYDLTTPAKKLIGDDIEKIKQVFNYIERNSLADSRFKELFKCINDKHKSGQLLVHENICKLIHMGHIKLVVSFNWDDLLETAWESLYGTNINDNGVKLLKPHGDVRNPSEKWIYPNSAGFLSYNDIQAIEAVLNNSPSTFVILGYSEQDRIIVDTFIKPNENKFVVYRISPSAYGDNAISLKASQVMQNILDSFNRSDNNLWIRLNFTNQVGLEHAIMGYRLLPSDVLACPRLSQIEDAKIRLEQAHCVVIEGAPGSGKSITAYQLAWDYLQNGWEILRLNISKQENQKQKITLENNGYKTIYIIDDAQQMNREQIIDLMTKANQTSKVLITQTITSNFPTESITISQQQAVEELYKHYKTHKDQVLPVIRATNKLVGRSVGDKPMETPLEFVLDVARKESTPWLFNYSVRGGWESTTSQYAAAREHERADLMITIIALKQIVTLDKPVNKVWINHILCKWGYTEQWISEQLGYLCDKKLIIDIDELRTLHLQMAIRVIANYLKEVKGDEGLRFYALIQEEFLNINNSLLGVAWFFNLLFTFDIKYKLNHNVFTDEFNKKLLIRCSQQTESESRSYAGFVIDRVLNSEAGIKYRDIVNENEFLLHWIENVDNQTAYSFSRILNSMINESREWQKEFVCSLDEQMIIENMKNIEGDYLYAWANFLGRLLYFHQTIWAKTFCKQIPKQEISNVLQKCTTKNVGGLTDMLCTLRFIDEAFCFEEYHKCIWIIEKSMKEGFMSTLENLDLDFLMYLLGENLFDLGRPNQKQKEAGQAFVECITPDMIRKCILEGTPRNWDTFYRFSGEIFRYDSRKFINAMKNIDFNVLDSKTDDMWEEQPDVLIELLYMLHDCDKIKTEEWIYSNKNKVKIIDTALTQLSPRTAEYVLNNGGLITLTKSHRWRINAAAVSSLRSYNKKMCYKIVEDNLADIKQSLYDLSSIAWKEYYLFLKQLLLVNKGIVDIIINDLDVPLLEEKWIGTLEDKYYNNQKKELQGFHKLTSMIKENSNNPLLIESMGRISEKINGLISTLKPFKYF